MDTDEHRSGRVTAYDAARGWGTVTTAEGAAFDFHCTAIADGSRTVGVGAEVRFVLRPGHRGRFEADRLEPAT